MTGIFSDWDACILAWEEDPRDPCAAPTVAFIDTVNRCNEVADVMRELHPGTTFFVRPAGDAVGLKREGEFIHAFYAAQKSAYRTDLTPAGEQLVIPGCERRPVEKGKPAQLSLF